MDNRRRRSQSVAFTSLFLNFQTWNMLQILRTIGSLTVFTPNRIQVLLSDVVCHSHTPWFAEHNVCSRLSFLLKDMSFHRPISSFIPSYTTENISPSSTHHIFHAFHDQSTKHIFDRLGCLASTMHWSFHRPFLLTFAIPPLTPVKSRKHICT